MLMGAVIGFIATLTTGSLLLGFILAILSGVVMSMLFAGIALGLNANQVATGLALTIFGTGLSAFIGADFVGQPIEGLNPYAIPFLSDIPLIGKMLFAQDLIVYLSFGLFAAIYWFFKSSRAGLTVKAVGKIPMLQMLSACR